MNKYNKKGFFHQGVGRSPGLVWGDALVGVGGRDTAPDPIRQ